ncbi:DUF3885 domain-containing protein [Alkalihalobacillus sp. NPDC078783]
MELNNFLNTHYPDLTLKPPLFYNWSVGIRFEVGVSMDVDYTIPHNPYIQGCYRRAITLFESLHQKDDDIIVVIDVDNVFGFNHLKRRLKHFYRYVDKSLLYSLKHEVLSLYPEEEDYHIETHRFSLSCKAREFHHVNLLKAICNQDFGLTPKQINNVYFINQRTKTIFHVYDDRGCDLIAASALDIKDIYKRFNDWILDYDREEIDEVFNGV